MLALEIDFKKLFLSRLMARWTQTQTQKISTFINSAKNLSNNHKCEKVLWGKGFKVSHSHTQSQPHHTRGGILKTCALGNRGQISTTVKVEQKHTIKPVLLRTVSV